MSDRIITGLYAVAYEGTDILTANPRFKITTDREMAEMVAEDENDSNSQVAKFGGPIRPRVVVVELLLPCRVVKG
jgi:hypothetical protein